MRTREEIESQINETEMYEEDRLMLEVLLDIRDSITRLEEHYVIEIKRPF